MSDQVFQVTKTLWPASGVHHQSHSYTNNKAVPKPPSEVCGTTDGSCLRVQERILGQSLHCAGSAAAKGHDSAELGVTQRRT